MKTFMAIIEHLLEDLERANKRIEALDQEDIAPVKRSNDVCSAAAMPHRRISKVVNNDGKELSGVIVAASVDEATYTAGLLMEAGMSVRVVMLPNNISRYDFNELYGKEAFENQLNNAPDFVSFYLENTEERSRTIEGRTEVARELFAILANISDELRKDQYIEHIAHGLNISRYVCRREFDHYIRQQSSKIPEPEQPAQSGLSDTARQHDVSFLALLLQNEAMFDLAKHELAGLELGKGPLEDNLRLLLDTAHGSSVGLSQRLATEEARRLYAAAAASTPVADAQTAEKMVLHRLTRMKKDRLKADSRAVQEELKEARRARDDARALKLLARKVEMERQISLLEQTP